MCIALVVILAVHAVVEIIKSYTIFIGMTALGIAATTLVIMSVIYLYTFTIG